MDILELAIDKTSIECFSLRANGMDGHLLGYLLNDIDSISTHPNLIFTACIPPGIDISTDFCAPNT
jgi:hypothetical protein